MSEHELPPDLPPLDADALALLRAGSELSQVEDAGRARLTARVMTTIAVGPGGGGGPGEGGGTSASPGASSGSSAAAARTGLGLGTSGIVGMGLTFVLGGALGFFARPIVSPAESVQNTPVASAEVRAVPEQHAALRTLESAALASSPADSTAAAPSALPSSKVGPARDLSAERVLLDGARAALGRGDPAAAVVAARTHEQRFPRGALAEEREALYVQALAQSGKMPEARARAARFKQNYPDSMLLPAVTAATDKASEKGAP